MKKSKALAISLIVLLIIYSTTLSGFTLTISSFAASATIPQPKVQGIVGSVVKKNADDLFFVDEFNYKYKDDNNKDANYTLNYRYYKPEDMTEKKPLIIFLHGRGERGRDNESQLNNAIMRPFITNPNSKFFDSMVIAPQCPVKDNNNGWVDLFTDDRLDYHNLDFEDIKESVECKAIVSLVKDTCEKQNVDKNRVYLIGLSQGAIAIWDLLARHSDLFAAAVPISGVGYESKASVYANVPIYAFHGQADTTVPYANATIKMYEAINAIGKNKMHFVTFSDGPHAIWEAAIVFEGTGDIPGLESWLFSQKLEDDNNKNDNNTGCGSSLDIGLFSIFSILSVITFITLKRKESY